MSPTATISGEKKLFLCNGYGEGLLKYTGKVIRSLRISEFKDNDEG